MHGTRSYAPQLISSCYSYVGSALIIAHPPTQVRSNYCAPAHTGPGTIVDIVRLLLSCLHAWNLDEHLDKQSETTLGLVRPVRPVCFGLMSKGGCLSLVLPGWGLRIKQHRLSAHSLSNSGKSEETKKELEDNEGGQPESVYLPSSNQNAASLGTRQTSYTGFTFDQKYHIRWQLSRSLTTQHLLTMVSITNTLMNQVHTHTHPHEPGTHTHTPSCTRYTHTH